MLIALDYDHTFSRDPLGWQEAIGVLKQHGHTVVGATMRHDHETSDMSEIYGEICDRIIFTGRKAKRAYLAEKGIMPDVWIDDMPEFICASVPNIE